jgi:predicted amidophosphoribosyltransferase
MPAPSGAALVDDVATTGVTLLAARAALKGLPTLAVTATSVGRVAAGEYPTHRVREVT